MWQKASTTCGPSHIPSSNLIPDSPTPTKRVVAGRAATWGPSHGLRTVMACLPPTGAWSTTSGITQAATWTSDVGSVIRFTSTVQWMEVPAAWYAEDTR